jgi:hypothetical protein
MPSMCEYGVCLPHDFENVTSAAATVHNPIDVEFECQQFRHATKYVKKIPLVEALDLENWL